MPQTLDMIHQPTPQENRIRLLDALRGIAVFGILLMNVPFFAHAYQIHFNINVLGEYSGLNYWTWRLVYFFFEGTMRGMFSILFGAGTLLFLDRLEKNPPEGLTAADIHYRRLIWLLIFGLFNAFILMWPGDILYCYALCGLFLYPFRKLPARKLLMFAGVFLVFSTLQHSSKMWESQSLRDKGLELELDSSNGRKLSEIELGQLEEWQEHKEKHLVSNQRKEVEKEVASMKSGFVATFEKIKKVNFYIQTKEMYHEYFFDALSFFLLGMALFKFGFLTGQRPVSQILALSLSGYLVGLTINYYWMKSMVISGFDLAFLADQIPFSFYQIKRTGITLGHLGLVILLFKLGFFSRLFGWMANVGQMAFSNYLLQSIIGAIVFHNYGFGMFGKWERHEWYIYVVVVWIFELILSQVWLKYFRFGPFEWLWRSLTWWKRQPFLR